MTPTVLIIDGSFCLYRAFFGLPALSTSLGMQTGAIKGVLNVLNKLLRRWRPTHVAVVFDAGGRNFRHKLSDKYKSGRMDPPDDLKNQMRPLQDILVAMGLTVVQQYGIEGDDIIGILTKQARDNGQTVVIASGDKDMTQLVDDYVTLVNPFTDVVFYPADVHDKYGILPSQFVDYLTLIGDVVDGIDGVQAVGPKTAVKWLNQYETLEGILANMDEIPYKSGEHLRNSLDLLELNRELVTINTKLALEQDIHDLQRKPEQTERLMELYQQFEFNALLQDLISRQVLF